MPVPKFVVDRYLSETMEALTWFKDLKPLEVEADLATIEPPHKLVAPLRHEQKVCFLFGVAYPEAVIMADLGFGKTAVSCELLNYFYTNGFVRRAFVFAPTNELAEEWEDEIKLWGFKFPFVRLNAPSSKEKFQQLAELDTGIVIGTYVGIAAMASRLTPHPTKKNKQYRAIDPQRLYRLTDKVDMVIYDQSTHVGNTNSLNYQVCSEFSRVARTARFGLAGRAFGRDPFMLWSQFYLTDRGHALGTSPGMFREAFWRRKMSPWGTSWVFRKRREKILAERVAASSIRYSAEECLDLPPKVPLVAECSFPEENWTYYDRIVDELIEAKGNYKVIKNSFLRMRQISSGFVGFKDDETGDKAQIEFLHNPKLDLLLAKVEEVPEDRKLLIFYEFNWSGARICQELAKRKLKHGWVWGGTKDWTSIKSSFINDPEYRIIVASWKKASMGLNLQSANYEFFYESPVDPINRAECEGRIYRRGQKHKSFIIDLVVKDSADAKILDFHRQGADLWKTLVENPAKLFGKKALRRSKP